jgi:hypothetical protein
MFCPSARRARRAQRHASPTVNVNYNQKSRKGFRATRNAAKQFAKETQPLERVKKRDFAPKNKNHLMVSNLRTFDSTSVPPSNLSMHASSDDYVDGVHPLVYPLMPAD